jgi:N-acetylmuramoyl-L-alanine amidase
VLVPQLVIQGGVERGQADPQSASDLPLPDEARVLLAGLHLGQMATTHPSVPGQLRHVQAGTSAEDPEDRPEGGTDPGRLRSLLLHGLVVVLDVGHGGRVHDSAAIARKMFPITPISDIVRSMNPATRFGGGATLSMTRTFDRGEATA